MSCEVSVGFADGMDEGDTHEPVYRENGRSRGFGFVKMPEEAGRNAIAQADGVELEGRPLRISEARAG